MNCYTSIYKVCNDEDIFTGTTPISDARLVLYNRLNLQLEGPILKNILLKLSNDNFYFLSFKIEYLSENFNRLQSKYFSLFFGTLTKTYDSGIYFELNDFGNRFFACPISYDWKLLMDNNETLKRMLKNTYYDSESKIFYIKDNDR